MLYQELTIHRGKHGPKQHSSPYPSALFLRAENTDAATPNIHCLNGCQEESSET